MKRKLWILWLQGFEQAPYVVTKCLHSWKVHNRDGWDIVELTEKNIGQYVAVEGLIQQYADKKINRIALSEIIRIELLKTYGGVWVDATTFCNKPLDSWLPEYIGNGFFAFELKNDRPLSSWFLYGDGSNYILDKWHEAVFGFVNSRNVVGTQTVHVSIDEWEQRVDHVHYFWFHYLFGDLLRQNEDFRCQWDKVEKISADGLHLIQTKGMLKPITADLKKIIVRKDHPLFKLTYKYQHEEISDSILAFLFQH